MRPAALALVGAVALLAAPAQARELLRRGDLSLEVTGSVREIAAYTRGTDLGDFEESLLETLPSTTCLLAATFADCPAFDVLGGRDVWQSLTRVRTRLDLRATSHVSAVVTWDHELLAGILDTFEGEFGRQLATEPYFDLEDHVGLFGLRADGHRMRWRHVLYRAFLKVETKRVELVAGRQRIPWGVGRLWNPIDRFNAIPPLAIEGDQSPGVDALDLKIRASGFSYLELAFAPADGKNDLYAARWHGVLHDVDYSLVAGRFEEAWTFGGDLAANLGGAAARLELVYANPTRDYWSLGDAEPEEVPDFFQLVLSLDYNLDVGSGLYVLVEHYYNGNATGFGHGNAGGLEPFFESTSEAPPGTPPFFTGPFPTPGSTDRFAGNRMITAAKHQTGFQAGYDLSAVVRANLVVLYDWDGTSAAFFPSLTATPLDAVELTLGAQLFAGSKRSQYGAAERLFFVVAEWFF
ncbi:MAG TPA: hypothetical protein VKB65_04910 [Myxococcota bacterium]|nr:hypothetical protein [Myxococcota bacterium]